jgi:mxaA protein
VTRTGHAAVTALRRCLRVLLALVALSAAAEGALAAATVATAAAATIGPTAVATIEQPRPFGHFLGDHLQQRVLLEHEGDALVPGALPQPERQGVWIERLSSGIETDPAGRAWLAVDYLIINAAPSLTTLRIPGWELKGVLRKTGAAVVQTVPPWSVEVAALTSIDAPGAEALRPDRPALPIAAEPIVRRLRLSLAALGVTLLSWLGWMLWRNWRAAARLPFAMASRQLRGLSDADAAAWHILHRAFERSAGRAVQASSLDKFYQAAPHFNVLRPEIEDFFARSDAFFFATGKTVEPMDLHGFCKALRRLEKRHER